MLRLSRGQHDAVAELTSKTRMGRPHAKRVAVSSTGLSQHKQSASLPEKPGSGSGRQSPFTIIAGESRK
jgi:hypothetical protein